MTCEAPWWTVNLSIFPNYIKLFTIYIYIYICNIYIYTVYQPLRLYHQKRDTPELFHPKTRNSQWPQQRPTWHDWKETPITQIMTPHSSAIEFLHSYIALNAWNIKRTWLFLSNSLSLSPSEFNCVQFLLTSWKSWTDTVHSPALLSFPTSILLMEVSALTAPPRSCKLQDGPRGCPNGVSTGYIVYIYNCVYTMIIIYITIII